MNGHHCPALTGAIELGDDQTRQFHRLVELAGLNHGIHAGGAIEHQQHLMRSPGKFAVHHTMHLLQLLHQVVLGMQSAGRVDEQPARIAGLSRHHRVMGDGGRIGLISTSDDRDFQSAAPQLELLDGRSTKSIASCQEGRFTAFSHALGQLGAGGRLAGAIDTHH